MSFRQKGNLGFLYLASLFICKKTVILVIKFSLYLIVRINNRACVKLLPLNFVSGILFKLKTTINSYSFSCLNHV